VALLILLTFGYKWMFQKKVMRTADCLDEAASAQKANSALSSVEKYAACVAWVSGGTKAVTADGRPARCRYAGVWTSTRGTMTYEITLEADGKFVGEPGQNVSANAQTVTGAWAVAGNSLVWAYDSGAVWPPDINPIFDESEKAFTLREVNGLATRYTLIERSTAEVCSKK
jgi:hypothetical protein